MKKNGLSAYSPTNQHLNARLTGLYFFTAASHRIASRRRKEPAELIIMLDGVYIAELPASTGGETLRATAGDVVFWPADAERLEINDPLHPTHCLAIYFTWRAPPLPNRVQDTSLILRLLGLRLVSLKQQPRKFPPAVWNGYLNALLAEYIRLAEMDASPMVNRVLDYVEQHMTEPITVDLLAEAAGLERHHFGRQFKKEKGMPPMDYVRWRRVEHTLGMMATDQNWTIKRMIQRVGIPNEILLRRWLKRYTGINLRDLKKMAHQHPHDPSFWPATIMKPSRQTATLGNKVGR